LYKDVKDEFLIIKMAKEILLYNYYLSNYSVETLIGKLDEAKSNDVDMRINCYGGDVFAAWGLFAKVKEHGSVNMKVDGIAASGAGNLLLYGKSVECLSVSRVMFHRADASVETEAQRTMLRDINTDLRKQLEMKVDAETFKTVTGYTIEQMFNPETRVDIWLTAAQLKKLKIVTKVVNLTPEQEKEVTAQLPTAEVDPSFIMKIAALWNPESNTEKNQNSNIMNLAELKEKHPAIYAEAIALGKVEGVKEGTEAERDRVGAAMVFASLDIKGVTEIIKSGKPMSATQMAEFTLKAASPAGMAALKAGNAAEVKTEVVADVPGDAAKKEADDFEKKVRAELGLDKTKVSEAKGIALAQIK
jgi:ATP-dependent Clp protease protease subunit